MRVGVWVISVSEFGSLEVVGRFDHRRMQWGPCGVFFLIAVWYLSEKVSRYEAISLEVSPLSSSHE